MRCAQVRRSLSAFLDGEVPAAKQQQIAAHLESCAECRAERDALAATWDGLLAWPEMPASVGFDARLHQRLAAPERLPWRNRLRHALWLPARRLALAGAAAGILVGWMAGHLSTIPAPGAADPAALRQEVVRTFALDAFAAVPPDSAGTAYAALTSYREGARR
jgi:anti-sigma factor RsiW